MIRDSLRQQILRGGIGSVVVKVLSTMMAFVIAAVLARVLGSAGYGMYAFALAAASLISLPAQFGLPNLVIRETARAHLDKNWQLMNGLWRWSNRLVGGIALILVCVGIGLVWVWSSGIREERSVTLMLGLACVPFMALGALRGASLKGLRHVVIGQVPEMILKPVLLLVLVLVALILNTNEGLSSSAGMLLYLISTVLAYLAGALLLRAYRPQELSAGSSYEYRRKEWLSATLPLAFLAGMHMVNQNTDILMLGVYEQSSDVGTYRIASQTAMLVVLGLQAVNMVVSPFFARLFASGDLRALSRLQTKTSQVSFILALPVVIAFILAGDRLLAMIFGPDFAAGYTALVILAIGQLVNASVGSVGNLLNMTGRERITALAVAVSAASNVMLNLLLIPRFGINGAAIATSISIAIWNGLLWWQARIKVFESAT